MQLSTPRAHLSSNRGGRGRSKPAVAAAESASSSPSNSSPTSTSRPRPQLRSPPLPPPGWDAQVSLIDSKPLSKLVLALFRSKMALALEGKDSDEPKGSYEAIVDLTKKLNALPPSETTAKTRNILKSLFPSWLPGAFAVLFSKPLPYISARINAEATALACEWLMGPTEVNDGDGRGETRGDVLDGSSSLASTSSRPPSPPPLEGAGHRTGCKVTYCRYLASTNCVSACLNSCKLPTQKFFEKDMGLPLRMSPDLDDFSCQFSFGVLPDLAEDLELVEGAGCLEGCSVLSSNSSGNSGILSGSSQSNGSGGSGSSNSSGSGHCPGSCALRGECSSGGG